VNGETLFALLQIDSAGSAVQERGSFVGLGGGERKGKTQAAEGECRRERGDQEGAGVERNGEDGGDWRERVVGGHYENWLIWTMRERISTRMLEVDEYYKRLTVCVCVSQWKSVGKRTTERGQEKEEREKQDDKGIEEKSWCWLNEGKKGKSRAWV
jgi:hypothetical protein